ncbi:MAG: PLP-dependent aspartate aminotransferase family protein [archaeon]
MKRKIETQFIHGGESPDPLTGAVAPTLVRSKTYRQEFGKKAEFQYARGNNPTRKILENKLASIEGKGYATVFSSGLGAETMFFLTLNPGDHIIIPEEVYGGTQRLLNFLKKFNIVFSTSSFESRNEILSKVRSNTKYFFIEPLSNPSLKVIDLRLIKKISEETSIPFVADMTFTPPCATLAFDYGAETIIHSLSKYMSGHNDVLGGAIITKNLALHEKLQFLQKTIGAVLSPDECYRIIQGIKTLNIRWKETSNNAYVISKYLSNNNQVKRTLYPGLKTDPHHSLAKSQIKNGFGSVVSFELKETNLDRIKTFIEVIQERGNIIYGESLASPETLIAYPFTMSHASLSVEEKIKIGVTQSFFRISLGLESPMDILEDLERGFRAISQESKKENRNPMKYETSNSIKSTLLSPATTQSN